MARKRRKDTLTPAAALEKKERAPVTSILADSVHAEVGSAVAPTVAVVEPPPVIPDAGPEDISALTPRRLVTMLSVEVACYALILLTALALRLLGLGARPLAAHEAANAFAAWQFVQGHGSNVVGSPLLMTANLVGFFLGADSDITPRLLPAIVGSVGVLLPLVVRREIGRLAALIASLLLLFSTSLVYFARDANGVEIGALAAVAAVIWLWRYIVDRHTRDLYLGAAAGAVGLTASSAGFTVLLAGLILLLVYRVLAARASERDDAPWLPPREEVPAQREGIPGARTEWRNALLLFLAVYIGLATALLMNREGLGGGFNLLGDWLAQFASLGPPTSPLNQLLLYEPFILVFGLAGLFLVPGLGESDWRTRGILSFLAILSALALVLYSLAGVKVAANMVVIVLPLALLAGWFIANLMDRTVNEIERLGGWRTVLWGELPVLILALALAAFLYLQLVSFFAVGRLTLLLDPFLRLFGGPEVAVSFELALGIILGFAVLVTLLLILAAIGSVGAARTANLAAVIVGLLLLLGGIRALWLANYSSAGPVHELFNADQTSLQARDLAQDLEQQSMWHANDWHNIAGRGDASLGPAVRWYLRAFPNLNWDQTPSLAESQTLITKPDAGAAGGAWMSTLYQIQLDWRLDQMSRIDLFKWLVFRVGGTENWQSARLWVPKPQ